MPKKIKLNLKDLNVSSFKTSESKGGAEVATYPMQNCMQSTADDCWSFWVCHNSIAGPFCW